MEATLVTASPRHRVTASPRHRVTALGALTLGRAASADWPIVVVRRVALMVVVGVLGVRGAAASATTVPQRTLRELLDAAVAVEVDVVGVRYDFFDWDGHRYPITLVDLAVVSVPAAGAAATDATSLLLPGGPEEDGGWMSVVGTPTFDAGERVLLLGEVDAVGVLRLSSFYRSVFRRRADDGAALSSGGATLTAVACDEIPAFAGAEPRVDDFAAVSPVIATVVAWDALLAKVAECGSEVSR